MLQCRLNLAEWGPKFAKHELFIRVIPLFKAEFWGKHLPYRGNKFSECEVINSRSIAQEKSQKHGPTTCFTVLPVQHGTAESIADILVIQNAIPRNHNDVSICSKNQSVTMFFCFCTVVVVHMFHSNLPRFSNFAVREDHTTDKDAGH